MADVKPPNIVYDSQKKKVYLCDWGSADFHFPNYRRGTVFGTVTHKAPELLCGKADFDFKVDIWAVGTVFGSLLFRVSFSLLRYFKPILVPTIMNNLS